MPNEARRCEHCKKDFIIQPGELSLYEKTGTELPVICADCRLKQHFSFWLFGRFRKGKSDLSGESLITVLPEKNRYPIYKHDEWYSDAWEAMDYGAEYDPSRPFFEQLQELQEKVPHPHQNGTQNTNCDWCDDVWRSKSCYLARSMEECEDLYYSYRNVKIRNSIDVYVSFDCEKSYDISDCHNSFHLFYSWHSRDCIDSYFLFDCRNCQNCFMCSNLRGKNYCIENEQYSKEEYEEKLKSYKLGSYDSIQKLREKFWKITREKTVHRENFNLKTTNSDGNYLINTKNCHNCNTISDCEDDWNCSRGIKYKSSIDADGCWYSELLGNCSSCVDGYGMKYSLWSSSRYSEYCELCIECESCFGCVGLKKKKYCVLNKQYSKEEYEKLVAKIISYMKKRGEYGKYLPYSMSPGPFNLSTSILYFPETKKEEIVPLGGYWEEESADPAEGMSTAELPDDIKDVPDDIITKPLVCPETGWKFNIAQNELAFHRANNLPLPRLHFDRRIKNRLKYLTVMHPYPYKCHYCGKTIMAYYPPDWGYQNIACEECYRQNIS